MIRSKLFKKYYKSPYHDYELESTLQHVDDEGRHPDISFIYSGRNRGKSYEVATQCLADAWYDNRLFAYVRRHETPAYRIEKYFADKLDFIKDMTDDAADGIACLKGELWLFKTSYSDSGKAKRDCVRKVGYFFALSVQGSHKSEQYPDCYNMIYEEVLTIDEPYLPGECEKTLNLYSTLRRSKTDFRAYLVANTVSIVNPYSKGWGLHFGQTKQDEVRLTKLYLRSYDDSGNEKYYLIAGHYLKDKDELTKEDLKKNRNRAKTSIESNSWDEAKLFTTIDLSFISQYDIIDTVVFEWDDVLMQGNLLEVPINILKLYIEEDTEPAQSTMPILYIRRKTSEPHKFTRLYTNNSNRFDDYTTKGFKTVYKIDLVIKAIMERGWAIGADNLTMNDFDTIWKKLKLVS